MKKIVMHYLFVVNIIQQEEKFYAFKNDENIIITVFLPL
jgi:hypothetical protein